MRTPALTVLFSCILLASCTPGATPDTTGDASSSSSVSSQPDLPVTRNVSYTGTLEELGVTIYQQGTHRLTLPDGRFILLEPADAAMELDTYLGKKVTVRGSVRPTVEAGGTLMRVEQVIQLDSSSSSSSSLASSASSKIFCGGIAGFQCPDDTYVCADDPSDSCDPAAGGADCGGICVKSIKTASSDASSSASSSVVSSASSSVRSSRSSQPASSSSAVSSSSVSSAASSVSQSVPATNYSAEMEAQIVAMAKYNYSLDSLWTKQYCNSTPGFCVPVHKQWWWHSFGASTTAGSKWLVEFGDKEPTVLGQGAISMNLLTGVCASAGSTSGQIGQSGNTVIGCLDWNNGQHIEIRADVRLKAAVEYLLTHVEEYHL